MSINKKRNQGSSGWWTIHQQSGWIGLQEATPPSLLPILDPPENCEEILPSVSLHFLSFFCARPQTAYDDIVDLLEEDAGLNDIQGYSRPKQLTDPVR